MMSKRNQPKYAGLSIGTLHIEIDDELHVVDICLIFASKCRCLPLADIPCSSMILHVDLACQMREFSYFTVYSVGQTRACHVGAGYMQNASVNHLSMPRAADPSPSAT